MTTSTQPVDQAALQPNPHFSRLASDVQIKRAASALETNGFRVIVAATAQDALRRVLELLPRGADVFTSTSRTLDSAGITAAIDQSGHYNAVRPRLMKMDWKTQGDEMRKLGAAPDYVVGSVHALTEDGHVLVASATGSQLGSYAYGGGKLVWVVGAQKVVPTVEEGFRRIQEYSLPLEDARARQAYGMSSVVAKVLLINRELQPGRVTIVLVKENLGF